MAFLNIHSYLATKSVTAKNILSTSSGHGGKDLNQLALFSVTPFYSQFHILVKADFVPDWCSTVRQYQITGQEMYITFLDSEL